jgi:hypothetical protein
MNIDWLKLRSFNGDVKNAFEELVCQLARAEDVENKKKFVRVAAPDGGVEAYCLLSSNEEYGWQAKFFSSMGESQWTQIEESFKTALSKHPNLIKYYVCIPLDRRDPRIVTKKGKEVKHFMDIWKEKVLEWETFALKKGRKIEFEYWGNSELFDRLAKPEHEGKMYFWFGQEEFSENWFRQKLDESINNLGKRYTPEINFKLPIAKIFEGLSRDKYFKEQFFHYFNGFLKNFNQAISRIREERVKESVEKIKAVAEIIRHICEQIDFEELEIINSESIANQLKECDEAVNDLIYEFYKLDSERK